MVKSRRRRRSKVEIVGDFLASCRQPRIKQEIIRRARLTRKDLHETIVTAMAFGLLQAFDGQGSRTQYKTTNKGNRYIHLYLHLKSLLETPDLAANTALATQE